MKPFFTISAIPQKLQRAFHQEEQARSFIEGNIRFGILQSYRKIEGWRQDETEGNACIQWNLKADNPSLNNVTYRGSSLNPYYILCASHSDVCSCHLKQFGRYIVRIEEPLKLLKRICLAWERHERASPPAFITPVLYNKGKLVPPAPYFLAPPCLTYAQKPAVKSEDREYRYVIECKVGTPEDSFITLQIGSCGDICSLAVV